MSREKFNLSEFLLRLDEISKVYHLKRAQLFELINISAAYYSMMKGGKRGGSFEMLLKIGEKFTSVNMNWLLFGEGGIFISDPEPTGVTALVANELLGVREVYQLAQELAALPESRRRKLVALFNSIIKLEEGEEQKSR